MPRTYNKTKKGQIFCIPWYEWMVECGEDKCDKETLVAEMGTNTLRQAKKDANQNAYGNMLGWKKRGQLWYCPEH